MNGRVLVYGGKGALGSACIDVLKAKKWWTCNVDLVLNDKADANVLVTSTESWTEQAKQISSAVKSTLGEEKLDAILCLAGGWAGGNAAAEGFISSCDAMWKQSVWSSAIAAQLASRHLKDGGLLQLTGAQAALGPTAFMMGYGMAKAAVMQLVKSLGSKDTGLPPNSTTIAILPITLDTPMNRKNMPKADFSTWTPLTTLAELLSDWSEKAEGRPGNGSWVEIVTKEGKTETKITHQ